jgi:hypothetical protein
MREARHREFGLSMVFVADTSLIVLIDHIEVLPRRDSDLNVILEELKHPAARESVAKLALGGQYGITVQPGIVLHQRAFRDPEPYSPKAIIFRTKGVQSAVQGPFLWGRQNECPGRPERHL